MWACGTFSQIHPHLFSWSGESSKYYCRFPEWEQHSVIKLPWSVLWQCLKYVWPLHWIASTDPWTKWIRHLCSMCWTQSELGGSKSAECSPHIVSFFTLSNVCKAFSRLPHIVEMFKCYLMDRIMLWSSVCLTRDGRHILMLSLLCIEDLRKFKIHWML